MSQNTLERELYEGRMKMQRDQLTMQEILQELRDEKEKATQEKEKVTQELQSQLAAEREASRKMKEVGRIQLCERLLGLPSSNPDNLLVNSLESLANKADDLERRLTNH